MTHQFIFLPQCIKIPFSLHPHQPGNRISKVEKYSLIFVSSSVTNRIVPSVQLVDAMEAYGLDNCGIFIKMKDLYLINILRLLKDMILFLFFLAPKLLSL